MRIVGEYWITTDGSTVEASGLGDTNHEGYALGHVRGLVLDFFEVHFEHDFYDWVEKLPELREVISKYLWDRKLLMADTGDLLTDLMVYQEHWDLPWDTFRFAFDPDKVDEDIRDYVARTESWKCVHNDAIGTWTFTAKDRQIIADGVDEILEHQGDLDADDTKVKMNISVFSTCKCYAYTLKELKDGVIKEEAELPRGRNAQMARMDYDLEPNFYKQAPKS